MEPVQDLCGDVRCQPGEKCENFFSCLALNCPPPLPPQCVPIKEQCANVQCKSQAEECVLKFNKRSRKIVGSCRPISNDPCSKIKCPNGTECIAKQKRNSRGLFATCRPIYIDPCSTKSCSVNKTCAVIPAKIKNKFIFNVRIGVCVPDPCLKNPCPKQFDCFPNEQNPLIPQCVVPITPCAYTTILCPPGTSCGRDPNNLRVATCL